MAEALVKFFLQRLESLLLQETQTFAALNDQIEHIEGSLGEIGEFLGDRGSGGNDDAFSTWVNQLQDLVHDMDDQVDEFIIQMDKQIGSDRLALTQCFSNELQKIESQLAEIIRRMAESAIAEEDTGEQKDNTEQSYGKEESQMQFSSTTIEGWKEENEGEGEQVPGQKEGQTSTLVSFNLKYRNLPYYLQAGLKYCCIFPANYWINKGRLIRLLVAEGLIQEKTGHMLEDIAEENINELVIQGMLKVKDEHLEHGTKFTVSSPYRNFIGENFVSTLANSDLTIPHTARHVLTSDMMKTGHSLNNLRPRSLFLFGNQDHLEGTWLDLTWAKFLRVLDLEDTKIQSLPDEVGDLIHLTYLGLKHSNINDLPARLGKLRALQTLDIRWCGNLSTLSPNVLSLVKLRHLKMFKNINVSGMKLPEGIGRLRNLLTLTGVHAGGSIAGELDKLTQLRKLGVMDVAEENAGELHTSIMKMQGLLCLSLEAKHTYNKNHLVLSESFLPPPLLRKLRLEGFLDKIPSWLGSLENLTKLRLGFSHLSENPTSVLQLLPNLENLTLWHAFDAQQLGKEFCKAGGFPKLEVLSIASHVLEAWTELEEGALPSLQYLHFHNCLRLRMLPEGLQYITTLKQLDLLPLLDEHAERLKPDGGEENYKIRNIPNISFITMSVLNSMVGSHPCCQTQVTSEQ
ncbi:hypothetical protein P3X46_023415 [Hevea brasiliensis]|uniref:Rx N-terminal domain-containing protein n=1 Tax=Hevea brasiliensis TaxID=3981 RepID=A0ABQ9LEN8_HEVBR|nr:disease resistance protein RPM1-like [Hevea brasiliensis]KAJ9163783.1 hypothetical protein P3X46_023415 [Hevea brasiliensis]